MSVLVPATGETGVGRGRPSSLKTRLSFDTTRRRHLPDLRPRFEDSELTLRRVLIDSGSPSSK